MGKQFKLSRTLKPISGTDKLIVNLSSSFTLTETQRSVILKGLSFVPASNNQKTLKIELLRGLQAYHRRIKLETFFEGKRRQKEKTPFTYSSDWNPPLSKLPKQTYQIIGADLYAYKQLHWGRRETRNLTISEERALNQIRKNRNIVIKPADKGNAVMLMNIEDYHWEQSVNRTYLPANPERG